MAPVDLRKVELPSSVRRAYLNELRRAFNRPFTIHRALVVNGVLMVALWLLTPASLSGVFFDIHQTWAFPTTLETWLLSDAMATNIFAADRLQMSAALDRPHTLARLVLAKQLVLWTFVAPACALVGVVIGLSVDSDPRLGAGVLITLMMPFAALGIAGWLGVWLPYHPVPLRLRVQPFRPFATLRWLTAVIVPYFVIWPITVCALGPSLLVWSHTSAGGLQVRPSPSMFLLGTVLAVGLTGAFWIVGNAVTVRMAHRSRVRLAEYLATPRAG